MYLWNKSGFGRFAAGAILLAMTAAGSGCACRCFRSGASAALVCDFPNGELYERARRASIEVLTDGHLAGSGWFVDSKGLIMTAAHVVGIPEASLEVVSTEAGRMEAHLVAVDRGHDLALLRVAPRPGGYRALPLARETPPAGTTIFLYGAPLYRHGVMLRGCVARNDAVFEWLGNPATYVEIVHVSGASPKGMSGGFWMDAAGEVVGLQSSMMYLNGAQVGVTFVASAQALGRLIRSERNAATPTLGAAFEEIWEEQRAFLDSLPRGFEGLVVRHPQPDGPMHRAGVENGEIVVTADGRAVSRRDDLLRLVRSKSPNEEMRLALYDPRSGERRVVIVTLDSLETGW